MLHDEVKRLADSDDVVGLRYVFVDALDADPTFEFYQEDYDYCRSKVLLEQHQELTPLTQDKTQWTKDYWAHLKVDLLKNLSEKRLMHMKEVAQVLKEDEIQRLQEEQKKAEEAARRKAEEAARKEDETRKKEAERSKETERPKTAATHTQAQPAPGSKQEKENQRVKAIIAQNARENAESNRSTEAARRETDKANAEAKRRAEPKKVTRIAIAATILVIILAVILVVVSNPGNAAAVLRAGAAFGKTSIFGISF